MQPDLLLGHIAASISQQLRHTSPAMLATSHGPGSVTPAFLNAEALA